MRPYAGESDLSAMQALLREAPSAYDIYPTASDLPAVLDPTVSGTPDHTVVWEAVSGKMAGFAIVSQYHNLHARFSPRERIEGLGAELIAWAVECLRLMTDVAEGITLDAVIRDDDRLMREFLEDHEFVAGNDSTIHMARPLGDPLPDVELPLGFTIRPIRGDSEVAAYVATHRSAYGTAKMTDELRRSIMRQPHYQPDLDLVVEAPDGALAAFCVSSINPIENERQGRRDGEIAIVGVHPSHCGLGLGRSIVLAAMRGLQRNGVDTAVLTVAGDNVPATSIYESAGFRADWCMLWYARPL